MSERPLRMNRRGGMGVFSNGGMEDEEYIPALEEYADEIEARCDRLREALDTILMLDPAAEDAAFLAVTVAGEALQEAER